MSSVNGAHANTTAWPTHARPPAWINGTSRQKQSSWIARCSAKLSWNIAAQSSASCAAVTQRSVSQWLAYSSDSGCTSGAAPVGAPATGRGGTCASGGGRFRAFAPPPPPPPPPPKAASVKRGLPRPPSAAAVGPIGGVPVAVAVVVGDGVAAAFAPRTGERHAPPGRKSGGVAPSAAAGAGAGAGAAGGSGSAGGASPPRRHRGGSGVDDGRGSSRLRRRYDWRCDDSKP